VVQEVIVGAAIASTVKAHTDRRLQEAVRQKKKKKRLK
jgi:hypothetical protein